MNLIQEQLVSFLLMVVLLVLSAFFSGSETALFSLHPDTVRRLPRNRHIDRLLLLLRRDSSELLSAILLGNLVVNILFFCTGSVIVGQWGAEYGEWIDALGGAIILVAVILFGEIVPKAFGVSHAVFMLRITAAPLYIWFRFTGVFRVFLRAVLRIFHLPESASVNAGLTSAELKELLDAVRQEPGFGLQEREILEDIVNLSDVRVREIMVPRVHVLRCSLLSDRKAILKEARKKEYSHVFVYRNHDDDSPLGVIRTADLFFSDPAVSMESLIQPVLYMPETKRADMLLREFMSHGQSTVAVVDEYGGLAGIVTVEDLFAEVVGDPDSEENEKIQQLNDVTYRLPGQLSIREWKELFTGFLPGPEMEALAFDTLGGFMISLLGRMPHPGDTVSVRNLRLTVESMHHRRIGSVLLHLDRTEEAA